MPPSPFELYGKQWDTSAWAAEWMVNAARYCNTSEGKRRLEAWTIERFGLQEGQERLRKAYAPFKGPLKVPLSDANGVMFAKAASGITQLMRKEVTPDALRLYVAFVQENALCMPARDKPAPTRRKDETAAAWLGRRNEALISGAQYPELDIRACKKAATSELDRIRDETSALRTDTAFFYDRLFTRQKSIIPSPWVFEMDDQKPGFLVAETFDDSWRAWLTLHNTSHYGWYLCAEMFEEFTRRNLRTPRALEQAYKSNDTPFWQILQALTALEGFLRLATGWMNQVISGTEYYAKWFSRVRTHHGSAVIRYKPAEVARSELDRLDTTVLQTFGQDGVDHYWHFFSGLQKMTEKVPSAARRFGADAYEAIGNYAIADDVFNNMYYSPWGLQFKQYADSMLARNTHQEIMSRLGFMKPDSRTTSLPKPTLWSRFGVASQFSEILQSRWMEVRPYDQQRLHDGPEEFFIDEDIKPQAFDKLLLRLDRSLWQGASSLDPPGQPGTVARIFGLYNPNDPERPSVTRRLEAIKERERARLEARLAAKEASKPLGTFEDTIPVAVPGLKDDAVVAGHVYAAESEADVGAKTKSKKKKKSKSKSGKAATNETVKEPAETDSLVEDLSSMTVDPEALPDYLPNKFILPRKMAKASGSLDSRVFYRLLDGRYDDTSDRSEEEVPMKGNVQWKEFEKVMRRIGFSIEQTAGSSVRFDPPAKLARPITFHRPHPDAVMTNVLARSVGWRLSKRYGWTMSTFEEKSGADE
ncbi:hypothetical protein PENSPDRAFT_747291 [Peniophora sp. CONT]|nr:hypothetical protein PENSPDRAFT_747291 [Peniophora sp. CONT]